jgi:hypothetical protein
MTALGISLIICGLTLVCDSMIFRLFTRQEPASSQEPSEERLFRINDEMKNEQGEDRLARTDQVLNDGKHCDK